MKKMRFVVTVDHLVNNAGVAPVCMFEESPDIKKFTQAMVIHFPKHNFLFFLYFIFFLQDLKDSNKVN